ncbi:MAG: hypothetical protein M3256_27905 [Actinomycetota bacterium]|nr:hypothetical protein [Actinomycetota bacterium]
MTSVLVRVGPEAGGWDVQVVEAAAAHSPTTEAALDYAACSYLTGSMWVR